MQRPWVRVALALPMADLFDYRLAEGMQAMIGQRVRVPFGAKELIGFVIERPEQPAYEESSIKEVLEVYDDLPPMPTDWLDFGRFAASYYQRPLGEALLSTLPTPLKNPKAYTGTRAAGGPVQRLLKRQASAAKKAAKAAAKERQQAEEDGTDTAVSSLGQSAEVAEAESPQRPQLSAAQRTAFQHITAIEGYKTVLLHGVTGSGKTEVYLHVAEHILAQGKQVMILVPEINLSPQLQAKFQERFPHEQIAILHSNLSDGERLAAWVAVQTKQAGIILGTRMAIFAPVQNLGLIVIDEEHDASYKQLDALRYSARDLAVWRGHQLNIPVVLGSATPSLESWQHAKEAKYDLCSLPERVGALAFKPSFEFIDTRKTPLVEGISQQMLDEIQHCIERGQQALVFINRRGFAPVLHCPACAWNSECSRCSAFMVMHRLPSGGQGAKRHNGPPTYQLQCHHCGLQRRPPSACPDCGNTDIQPLGRGTQKVEEYLRQQFPDARIQRIDADSTKRKGQAEELFNRVHEGKIDILVGTQMVSKGHDFKNLNLVCVLNADAGLYAHDFRSSERLFAQLLQVAGRAGRHLPGGKVLIQSNELNHPLYQALQRQDYELFAEHTLQERRLAQLPPFSFQTLVTASSKEIERCLAFLEEIKAIVLAEDYADEPAYQHLRELQTGIRFYDPVPLRIVRVFHMERAQLLIESASRARLQRFLPYWAEQIAKIAKKHRLKYVIEVDPLEI
ncbi:primosomal protein N' [Oligella urethralis]|uniref:primosomal protein N' n=1 Tax=Oligella urethralis TaxID=90245 RepID=UPI00036B50D1|nr:primosomal protein N' [Oligella urethralis]SUA57044.1 Primosomal protein N' [Oligella urethralis]SUA63342.1 Primosomal protein N' [Oligella urethralis]